MQMLGDGYLSPEAGVSCFERCDLVLHPLNRFADKLNEEYSSLVCHLTLPSTGRLYPETRKVIQKLQASLPTKEIQASNGAFVKGKIQERRTKKSVGSRERK